MKSISIIVSNNPVRRKELVYEEQIELINAVLEETGYVAQEVSEPKQGEQDPFGPMIYLDSGDREHAEGVAKKFPGVLVILIIDEGGGYQNGRRPFWRSGVWCVERTRIIDDLADVVLGNT